MRFPGRKYAGTIDWSTIIVATGSLGVIFIVARFVNRVSGSIVALFAATAIVAALGLPIETDRQQVRRCSVRLSAIVNP